MVFDRYDIFVIALVILVVVTVAMGVRTIPQGYNYTIERFRASTRARSAPDLGSSFPISKASAPR